MSGACLSVRFSLTLAAATFPLKMPLPDVWKAQCPVAFPVCARRLVLDVKIDRAIATRFPGGRRIDSCHKTSIL